MIKHTRIRSLQIQRQIMIKHTRIRSLQIQRQIMIKHTRIRSLQIQRQIMIKAQEILDYSKFNMLEQMGKGGGGQHWKLN